MPKKPAGFAQSALAGSPVPESTETLSMLDTSTAPGVHEPTPILLRSSRDYGLALAALENEAGARAKLAKMCKPDYPREAHVMELDAAALSDDIAPLFRSQQELPLTTPQQLEQAVLFQLRGPISAAAVKLGDLHLEIEEREAIRDRLVSTLSHYIAQFGHDCADKAFSQGYALRQSTPEHLALGCVDALRIAGSE